MIGRPQCPTRIRQSPRKQRTMRRPGCYRSQLRFVCCWTPQRFRSKTRLRLPTGALRCSTKFLLPSPWSKTGQPKRGKVAAASRYKTQERVRVLLYGYNSFEILRPNVAIKHEKHKTIGVMLGLGIESGCSCERLHHGSTFVLNAHSVYARRKAYPMYSATGGTPCCGCV